MICCCLVGVAAGATVDDAAADELRVPGVAHPVAEGQAVASHRRQRLLGRHDHLHGVFQVYPHIPFFFPSPPSRVSTLVATWTRPMEKKNKTKKEPETKEFENRSLGRVHLQPGSCTCSNLFVHQRSPSDLIAQSHGGSLSKDTDTWIGAHGLHLHLPELPHR